MGIFIYENVSKSVTKAEWEKVYEETLVLVDAFPLAERSAITYSGKKVICAVRSKEREMNFRGYKKLGWCADMDYDTLDGAEEYFLPRDLIGDKKVCPKAGDAMMGGLQWFLDSDDDTDSDEKFNQTYFLWDSKTQGEPYHLYLLAIACLIEDRLGEKAFVYGDLTLGQCRKAVEMANLYLEKPICIPARCEMDRLYKRVQKLPLEEQEKFDVFEHFYLGLKDSGFYEFERAHFHEAVWKGHWKKVFLDSRIGSRGFVQDLKKYLSAGLGLEELCGIVRLEEGEEPQYKAFVKAVMDSKLHIKEKNTQDCLDINPESEQPFGIWTLFADFAFGSAHNPKVDRYIPIQDIRLALKKGIGKKFDVDKYIDQYLEEEAAAPKIDVSKENLSTEELEKMTNADAPEVFRQIMDKKICELESEHDKYDISDFDDLMDYKKGDAVEPRLLESLERSFQFYHGLLEEEEYKHLMKKTHEERCAFLIEQNCYLMIRDMDWIRIFSEIENDPDTYGRYYPMVRVKCDDMQLNKMVKAFVLNDGLYQLAEETWVTVKG